MKHHADACPRRSGLPRRAAWLAGTAAALVALGMSAYAQDDPAMAPDPDAALEAPAPAGDAEAPAAEGGSSTLGIAAESDDAGEVGASEPFEGQILAQDSATFSVSELIGAEVAGPDGTSLGRVRDLLLTEDERLDGIVVAVGGFLGFGEKLIGVEIGRAQRLGPGEGGPAVVLDLAPDALERAPAFVSLEEQRRMAEEEAAREASARDRELPSQPPPQPPTQ